MTGVEDLPRFDIIDTEDPLSFVDLHAVLEVEWEQGKSYKGSGLIIPCTMITGEKKYIAMTESFILEKCEAPSVEEFLAKKIRDSGGKEVVYGRS